MKKTVTIIPLEKKILHVDIRQVILIHEKTDTLIINMKNVTFLVDIVETIQVENIVKSIILMVNIVHLFLHLLMKINLTLPVKNNSTLLVG
jgi:hypothetical protein